MISTSGSALPFPSLLSPTSAFGGFKSFDADDGASGGLGVSTAAGPLIAAPMSRQMQGFQASIAPPTRPTNPAIAPPAGGDGNNPLSGTGSAIDGTLAKLAYIAAMRLEMASSQGNGASGSKKSSLEMAGKAPG